MAQQERSKAAAQSATPSAAMAQQMSINLAAGKVIMVYSPKGGVGTTTLAVNLAVALNNSETNVALVDAKLQYGDVGIFMNEQGKNTILDLAPRADELDQEVVESVMIKHAASGVRVLAAPPRPEQAEHVSADQFSKLIRRLRQIYAYVVIDTSSALTDITLSALDTCDVLVLVVSQDIPAIKNARLFLDLLQSLGIQRERVAFAMNKYDRRISITPEKVGENLKLPVAGAVPLDERVVIPSVNRGVPFMVDNRNQPCARAVMELAANLRAQLDKIGDK